MGKKYLIDTNIIIYHFKDDIPEQNCELVDKIFRESFNISVISKIEFLGWRNFSTDQIRQAKEFLLNAKIYQLSNSIADKTIHIRQTSQIKLPDAVIAATCLINDFILVTRNIVDFSAVEGINIINPFDIS